MPNFCLNIARYGRAVRIKFFYCSNTVSTHCRVLGTAINDELTQIFRPFATCPNFYRGEKVRNIFSILDPSWFWRALVLKRSNFGNPKHSLRAPMTALCLPKFGSIGCTQFWDVRTWRSSREKRARNLQNLKVWYAGAALGVREAGLVTKPGNDGREGRP